MVGTGFITTDIGKIEILCDKKTGRFLSGAPDFRIRPA